MNAAFLYKEQVKEDITYLSQMKKQKGSERNILNKWFQDSIKNYFLETYASPFLKNEVGEGFVKNVKLNIEKKMPSEGLKFMNLLNQYKIELDNYGKSQKFVNSLIHIVIDDQKLERGSAIWAKQIKKKFVALMLIVLMEYNESKVTSFYDMWNYIFPCEAQIKKKLSKVDKLRQKNYESGAVVNAATGSPINSSTTLGFTANNKNQINNNNDNSSQCSRTCEFQDIENAPINTKKCKIETKQEAIDTQYIQQQQYQQQLSQIQQQQSQQNQLSFIPSQQYQSSQLAFKQQEFMIRSHSNSQINQQYNPTFLNTTDFIRRMSYGVPLKQEVHDEFINLDDPQYYIERLDEAQIQQQYQQQTHQASLFAQQPQIHFQSTQNQQLSQLQTPANPNTAQNGYFYNNVDLNNYFNVDQLYSQNNYAASQNIY